MFLVPRPNMPRRVRARGTPSRRRTAQGGCSCATSTGPRSSTRSAASRTSTARTGPSRSPSPALPAAGGGRPSRSSARAAHRPLRTRACFSPCPQPCGQRRVCGNGEAARLSGCARVRPLAGSPRPPPGAGSRARSTSSSRRSRGRATTAWAPRRELAGLAPRVRCALAGGSISSGCAGAAAPSRASPSARAAGNAAGAAGSGSGRTPTTTPIVAVANPSWARPTPLGRRGRPPSVSPRPARGRSAAALRERPGHRDGGQPRAALHHAAAAAVDAVSGGAQPARSQARGRGALRTPSPRSSRARNGGAGARRAGGPPKAWSRPCTYCNVSLNDYTPPRRPPSSSRSVATTATRTAGTTSATLWSTASACSTKAARAVWTAR